MQLNFWDGVKNFILSPINNPKVEKAFVILIIPFFVNVMHQLSDKYNEKYLIKCTILDIDVLGHGQFLNASNAFTT